jgi:hypothetical protein
MPRRARSAARLFRQVPAISKRNSSWRIEGEHPYLYLDGIVMKRSCSGDVRNVSLLAASAVIQKGFARFYLMLGQRFRGSNHIRRSGRVCRTKCG